MKIGIQTYHAVYNVGAMLQALATALALKKLGHESQIIDYYPFPIEQANEIVLTRITARNVIHYANRHLNPFTIRRLERFRKFRNLMPLTRRYYSFDDLKNDPPLFDLHVSGSDQIWNITNKYDPVFFLTYLPTGKNKISYASSFGVDSFQDTKLNELNDLLKDYQSIAVREISGAEIIRRACGREAKVVLDPTFLLTPDEWSKIADQAEKSSVPRNGYWYMSQLEMANPNNKSNIEKINKSLRIPCVEYTTKIFNPRRNVESVYDAGPLEFLDLVRGSKFVCTSSFHTMAFALHFHKDFYVIRHSNGRNCRMDSLLEQLGLQNRIVECIPEIITPIDYSAVDIKRQELVNQSFDYLVSATQKKAKQ